MIRHSERRIVGYAPRQMFDLVADVARYPEFLPWCTAARMRRRESASVEIDELAIGFGFTLLSNLVPECWALPYGGVTSALLGDGPT